MTSANKHLPETGGPTRNAADPYTIRLTEEPYLLSKEMLERDTDTCIRRKRDWHYPKMEFISLDKGTLKMKNSYDNRSFELTVFIKPDEIKISCNCGMQVETLCVHSYRALERLTWLGTKLFFKQYQPSGLVEIATAHNRYFTIKPSEKSLEINPKPELGNVYYLSDKINLSAFNQMRQLPASAQPLPAPMKDAALIYILADSYKDKLPPFLLPCIGRLNKAGTEVKWLDNFISGTQKKYDKYITEEQRTLNLLCYEMWQLAESLPGSLLSSSKTQSNEMRQLFQLWQQTFPLLQNQSFVYRYGLYWQKELKGKPSRQRLDRVEIRTERPILQFVLSDRGDIYQLQLRFQVKGLVIERFSMVHLFFIRYAETMYLLSSLRDAGIVEWMDKNNNCITIFKEHFSWFEQDILTALKENYTVEIIRSTPLRITSNKNPKK